MCDCQDCNCNDKLDPCCQNSDVPHQMDETTGNVICDGKVNCDDCCDILCMQVYNEQEDKWMLPCGTDSDCLDECGPVCEYVIEDPQNPIRPSGMPNPSGTYPGGAVPSGTTTLECGDVSYWFYHEYTANIRYKVNMGPGANPWPWNQNIMRTWNAQRRAAMENGWACANLPTAKLKEFAEKAMQNARNKYGNRFVCAPCTNGTPCPQSWYAEWKPQTDANCKNGRMNSFGPDANGDRWLNVNVRVTGRFKVCVFCNKFNCAGNE